MDPITAMALGSTALTSLGKLYQGFAGSSLDRLQEGIANSNADLLLQSAKMQADEGKLSLDQGALDQSRTIANVNRTLGGETGKFTASNLDPTAGSPLLLEGYSAAQGSTDVALIGAKAELGNAQALMQSAQTMGQRSGQVGQAVSFGAKATSDIVAGITGAASSMLTGLSSNGGAQWNALKSAASSIGSGGSGSGNFFTPTSSAYVSGGAIY